MRGDKEGSYDLTVDYRGVLMPFMEPVEAVFKTDEPLVVNGARGLSINLFPPTVAVPGEPYAVPFTLRNDSDITFNMVEFTLAGGPLRLPDGDGEYVYVYNDSPVRYAFATGENQEEIPIVFSGDSIFVKELHPGEYITAVFIATFPYNEEVWYYRLIESFSTELAGSTVSIPVHISPEWVDPPHIPGEWWNILEFAIGFVGYVIDTVNPIAMIRNIWPTVEALIELARELRAGNITAADLAIMLFEASFDDILWMIDNAHMFLNFFDLTREQARELGRRSAGVIVEVISVALIVYGAAKAAVNATRWLRARLASWRPFLRTPATSNGTLNIGAGSRPIEGAFNIDIEPRPSVPGVHEGNVSNLSNIRTGSQSRIILENPHDFNPLHPEVLRVLQQGGRIEITGSPANGTVNRALNQLDDLGLRRVGEPINISNVGQFTDTGGNVLGGTFYRHIIERID